jgi:hypothetical protein
MTRPGEASDIGSVFTWPPENYDDVVEGALCAGMRMEDIAPTLCHACPVKDRCNALYEDLQFGTLSHSEGKVQARLSGTWGGHTYDTESYDTITLRDGVRWYAEDRPKRKEWA